MKTYRSYMIVLLGMWSTIAVASPLKATLNQLQHQWAVCEYQKADEEKKQTCFQALVGDTNQHLSKHPDNLQLQTALAINLASLASVSGTSDALDLIKQAKHRLEPLQATTTGQLHTAVLVTLGALYYRAPGWPISFGDDDKAAALLSEAVELSPNDITARYFYGDFLAQQGHKQQAIYSLKRGLESQSPHLHPLVIQGRKQDIHRLLNTLRN
ncbi:tetratricopeptide repeat protein [Vibrio palustris]|uniref:Uncharacterized protein n=1 Tax=Vibrio palustris TaxID=1918946 RepID=A0A1R4B3K2_9VIBR|nr:tetratricopeptide repeat protein [Vibrio palustris]SJL83486.1 hypothetical protein VPAL9027_01454 [Vibrio palustris]